VIKTFKEFSINEATTDKDWGWFSPDYKLYSFSNLKRLVYAGKIQNPGILKRMHDHHDFIGYITNGKITNSVRAISQGWVRWMITKGGYLYVHFEKNITDRKKLLRSFMDKMKTPYTGVVIEVQKGLNLLTDYGMDLTPAQFIEYFDTEELWSFKDRKTRRLDEYQFHDEYKEWGLVSPSGKFYSSLDPMFSKFMDENNPDKFYHSKMFEYITTGKIVKTKKTVRKFDKFDNAVERDGWIRWSVEDSGWRGITYLNIDMNIKVVDLSNILKLLNGVSAKYQKINLDTKDESFTFLSRTDFLSFLKNELIEEVLSEAPHDIKWYRDWGYVTPDGKVISGLLRPVMTNNREKQ